MKILAKPSLYLVPAICIFIFLLYKVLLASNYRTIDSEISKYVSQWEHEITTSLYYNKNQDLVKKLVEGLKNFPVLSYELVAEEQVLYKWPINQSHLKAQCESFVKNDLTMNGLFYGQIKSCVSNKALAKMTLSSSIFIFVILIMIALLLGVSFFPLLGYKRSLNNTIALLKRWSKQPNSAMNLEADDKITHELIALVKQGIDIRLNLTETQSELSTEREFSRIAEQVAHDIRHPAMSLKEAMLGDFDIPEEEDAVIKSSIKRILETSDSLLKPDKKNSYRLEKIKFTNVSDLMEEIVKDKKMLYKHINFEFEASNDTEALCSSAGFKRVLSNLINNSVEAIPNGSGKILCRVTNNPESCQVVITDNGQGISEEHIDSIFNEHFTIGKDSGSGVGLYHAHRKVKEWGGNINVTSQVGKGTTIELDLKKPPEETKTRSA